MLPDMMRQKRTHHYCNLPEKNAYHNLMMGKEVIEVLHNNWTVFTKNIYVIKSETAF